MDTFDLTDDDRALLDAAKRATSSGFEHGKHYVGAALRGPDGSIYTGLNIETNIGRAAVCAEPVAIGSAVSDGVSEFETIVAVRHPAPGEGGEPFVVAPCGVCREMITDFGRDSWVIFPDDHDRPTKARAIDLLPSKYIRSYRDQHVE
jgi:cytidine deaminase